MSKENLILTNCRNKALLVLDMLNLALKLEGEQQLDAIAAAQKGFSELNERMLRITPKEPKVYDPNDNGPRKRICYVIYDSDANLTFAGWDEDDRDEALKKALVTDERSQPGEMIVNVLQAKLDATAKLNELDKLVLGMSAQAKPKPVMRG